MLDHRRSFAALFAAVLATLIAAPAAALRITEYDVPTPGGHPWGITSGPDGALWFTENGADKIGRITTSGVVTEYPVAAGSGLTGIVRGPMGHLWFAQTAKNAIGWMDWYGIATDSLDIPTPGAFTRWLAAGYDDGIWFTEQAKGKIGHVSAWPYTITEYAANTPNGGPYAIVRGLQNGMYYTENAANRVAVISEHGSGGLVLFDDSTFPTGLAAGDDGHIWIALLGDNAIVTTAGGAQMDLPTPASGVDRIIAGPDGAMWFLETSAHKLGRISRAGHITEYALPGDPQDIAVGPDGNLWITEFNRNKILKFVPHLTGDVNDDGAITVTDVFWLINFLFAGGAPPQP